MIIVLGIEDVMIMIGIEDIMIMTGIEEDIEDGTGINDGKNTEENLITIMAIMMHGGIHTGINGLHQL